MNEPILTEKLLGTSEVLAQEIIRTAKNPWNEGREFDYYVALLAFSRVYPQATQEPKGLFFRDNRFNRISPFKFNLEVSKLEDRIIQIFTRQTGRGREQSITKINPEGEPKEITLVEYTHYQNKDGTGETNYSVNKDFYKIVPYVAQEKDELIERIIGQMKERICSLEKLAKGGKA